MKFRAFIRGLCSNLATRFFVSRKVLAGLMVAALLLFGVASSLFIGVQGVHDDDGRRGLHGIEMLNHFVRPTDEPWRLMELYYIGTLNSFLLVPTIGLLGPTPVALRLPYIVLALAGMGLMFLVLRRLLQMPTALLAVCLLALNSTWIRSARLGEFREEILQIFFFWLVLALLLLPRRPQWVFAAFVTGVALWSKIMFVGYLAGMALAVMMFGPLWEDGRAAAGPPRRGVAGTSVLAFLAGLLPWLWWNYVNGWTTVKMLLHAVGRAQEDRFLCDNTHLGANLLERLFHLLELLSSQIAYFDLDGVANPGADEARLFLVVFSTVGIAVFLASRPKLRAERKALGFFAVVYTTMFLCSCYAPVLRLPGHLTILLPGPEIAVAFFFCRVLSFPPVMPWLRSLVAAWMTVCVGTEGVIMVRVLDRIHHGRIDDFRRSPAMFPLARALRDEQAKTLVTFCSEMGYNLGYLCGDRMEVHYSVAAGPPSPDSLLLQLPKPMFILTLDGRTPADERDAWFSALRAGGLTPEPFRVFAQAGYIFRLYKVVCREASAGTV